MDLRDVDCEKCKNEYTYTCCGCIHGPEPDDYYEPYSDTEWAAVQEERRQEAIEAIDSEYIDFEAPEEFSAKFELIKQFFLDPDSPNWYSAYYCAYCGKDYLLATNTCVLVKIQTIIPVELQGKALISLEENKTRISLMPADVLLNGRALKILDSIQGKEYSATKSTIPVEAEQSLDGDPECVVKVFGEVFINKQYLDMVFRLIQDGEIIQACVKDKVHPIVFQTSKVKAAIMPIRRG